jgi:hypothetical protein
VNNDQIAQCPIISVGECLTKIGETWVNFGKVRPTSKNDTEADVANCAWFYLTLFAATWILPKKRRLQTIETEDAILRPLTLFMHRGGHCFPSN